MLNVDRMVEDLRPSKADLRRLLNVADKRGFPGMVGSLDFFDEVCRGESPQVKYNVGDRQYGQCYYLVYGIYPKWGTFVKAIRNPITPQQAHFTKMQESFRKDVERAFGILQARFAIVRGPARGWDREDIQYIMMTCIILHNMIVEDERDETGDNHKVDPDEVPTRPRRAEIYNHYEVDHLVERDPPALGEFMRRYQQVRYPIVHKSLQEDFINHLWNVKQKVEQNRM
ncbi:PREDICTED: uncharacterized protein LOC101296794 [Fragaria vesca subsp. vesca]